MRGATEIWVGGHSTPLDPVMVSCNIFLPYVHPCYQSSIAIYSALSRGHMLPLHVQCRINTVRDTEGPPAVADLIPALLDKASI